MGYVSNTFYNDLNGRDIQTYVHEQVVNPSGEEGAPEKHIYIDHALLRPDSHGEVRISYH